MHPFLVQAICSRGFVKEIISSNFKKDYNILLYNYNKDFKIIIFIIIIRLLNNFLLTIR